MTTTTTPTTPIAIESDLDFVAFLLSVGFDVTALIPRKGGFDFELPDRLQKIEQLRLQYLSSDAKRVLDARKTLYRMIRKADEERG